MARCSGLLAALLAAASVRPAASLRRHRELDPALTNYVLSRFHLGEDASRAPAPAAPLRKVIRPKEGSPFKNTVLLLQGVRPERRKYLEDLYDPLFEDVLSVQWLYENEVPKESLDDPHHYWIRQENWSSLVTSLDNHSWQMLRDRAFNIRPKFTCSMQVVRIFYHALCLPSILKMAVLRNPHTRGLLTCHADFWFHPAKLVANPGLNFNALWQLTGGLEQPERPHFQALCLDNQSQITKERSWHWRGGQDRKWALLFANSALRGGYDATVCMAWVDAFYMPRTAWDRFMNLSLTYTFHLNHEMAIPSIFRLLNKYHDVPLVTEDRCWGGCCMKRPANLPHLRQHVCGHRMDLTNESVRAEWQAIVREEVDLIR